jgi:HK97 family phage major capsid protein
VSRQGLERAQYNEQILFEDLTARYWADLDVQCINGDGTGVNMLGLLKTTGIKTSAATSGALWAVYQNIADVIQQINSAVGGLGYSADKIVMHPRRGGSFVAAHDSTDRPILGINGLPVFNVDGQGVSAGYGFVGNLQGLPVYTDANVPTNSGDGTDDSILIFSSGLVHLAERDQDPVTLAFEQQAGTALSVRLIAYGYASFTAGRYPAASGAVTGLAPPTFGS